MARLRLWLLGGMVLLAQVARAEEDRGAAAKQHFETGMAHFHLDEWDQAIAEWEAGFRLRPVPEFLYNIGQAYRMSKRPEKALSFYQKYLHLEPKAPNRAEVERHIATLTKLVEEQKKASSLPPTDALKADTNRGVAAATPGAPASAPPAPAASVEAKAPPPGAPEPVKAAPPPPAAPAAVAIVATAPPPPPKKHIQGWVWGVVAGGAALVAGAVVLGVVLGTGGDNTKTLPQVTF